MYSQNQLNKKPSESALVGNTVKERRPCLHEVGTHPMASVLAKKKICIATHRKECMWHWKQMVGCHRLPATGRCYQQTQQISSTGLVQWLQWSLDFGLAVSMTFGCFMLTCCDALLGNAFVIWALSPYPFVPPSNQHSVAWGLSFTLTSRGHDYTAILLLIWQWIIKSTMCNFKFYFPSTTKYLVICLKVFNISSHDFCLYILLFCSIIIIVLLYNNDSM
jgi:hypothetical protein